MPDGTNNIWVDSTFSDTAENLEDVYVEYFPASVDNIGSYSMPVIYRAGETEDDTEDVQLVFLVPSSSVSGSENISSYYYNSEALLYLADTPSELTLAGPTSSGTIDMALMYLTGYTAVSGALDKRLIYTAGKQNAAIIDISSRFSNFSSISGVADFLTNYTNYTGSTGVSGIPIGFFDGYVDDRVEYRNLFTDFIPSYFDNEVEIFFAGIVRFPFDLDVYSTLESISDPIDFDVVTISGGVLYNVFDVFSTIVTASGLNYDVYCALSSIGDFYFETVVISGSVTAIGSDVFSSVYETKALTFDVDLYSLKVSNFSLSIGGYTTSSGYISVDVTDDQCPVSTSGTHFVVDGTPVSGTLTSITDGYRVTYDPSDDFASFEGPTTVTIHAENDCGNVLERDYYLVFGYIVEFDNDENKIDYGFGNKVLVRIGAEDYASCPTSNSLAWEFESKEVSRRDLTASIVAVPGGSSYDSLSAEIYPQSTAYFYGKEFTITVNAKDFDGNQMEPFILVYRIEDKP